MTGVVSSTFAVPERIRARKMTTWRDSVAKVHAGLDFEPSDEHFAASMDVFGDRNFQLLRIEHGSLTAHRTKRLVADDDDQRLILIHVLSGSTVVDQGAAETVVPAGGGVLIDLSTPYRIHYPVPTRSLVLTICRNELRRSDARAAESVGHAMSVDGQGLGGPSLAFVRGLWPVLENQGTSALEVLRSSVIDTMGTLLATSPDTAVVQSTAQQQIFRRALALIESSCHNSNLNVDILALEMGLSRRALSRIFAANGATVAQEITEARLARAGRLLQLWGNRVTVESIARNSGFRSPSVFHARFHERFGVTPRQFSLKRS